MTSGRHVGEGCPLLRADGVGLEGWEISTVVTTH
eukprot:SAG11_NODE_17993_length_502_cov_5.987593_1_plen_33_part_10